MTIEEYESLKEAIIPSDLNRLASVYSDQMFRWQLLKALWEIRDALKRGLDD